MFQQTPQGWTRSAEPIAHGMSSLGLGSDDSGLVLTAQCFWGDCGNVMWRHLVGPPVHGIRTEDLQTWSPAMWRLVDKEDRVPIDTELRQGEGGSEVWYYGTRAGAQGDPALHEQAHTIYRARVSDDRLVEPMAMLTGAHLADPAPVRFRGVDMVFLTTEPGRAISRATGTPLALNMRFEGVSVPHAMVVGESLWLWAHTVREGRHVPVRATSEDGESWTPFAAILPTEGIDCANPVGTVWQGQAVVFCVSEPLGRGPE